MRQLFDLRLLPAEGEAEVHDELAALARFAFKGDGAAHQVYDILGDGKAETRALNAADGGAFLVHKVRQMHRLFLDLHLAALDAAHIQHIVDEGEQVLAGDRDLFQVVQHLFLIINMGRRQRGEADDGVHRGADVVAHVEQELPLGTVCRCLVPDGKLQLAVLLLQLGVVFLLLLPLLLFRKLHGAMAQRLCGDGIVIFFEAGGLHLYKADGAGKVFLGNAHGLPPGKKGDCQQKQHPHQQIERRHPDIGADGLCNGFQCQISGVVAVGIVADLEIVDIHQGDARRAEVIAHRTPEARGSPCCRNVNFTFLCAPLLGVIQHFDSIIKTA